MKHYRTVRELEQFRQCKTLGDLKKAIAEGDTYEIPVESKFQEAILASLREWRYQGHICNRSLFWKQQAGQFSCSGLPDIFCVIDGHLLCFEVKRPFGVGKPTEIQKQKIRDLQFAGACAGVVSFPSEVKECLYLLGLWREI